MTRVVAIAEDPAELLRLERLVRQDGVFELAASMARPAEAEETAADLLLWSCEGTPADLDWLRQPWAEIEPRWVLLVRSPSPGWTAAALAGGAVAVLPVSAPPGQVIAAMEAAAAGLVAVPAEWAPAALETASAPADEMAETLETLTPRETEVLRLLGEGAANKEIAWRLKISEHTAKFHVASILGKLSAGSRAEAVAIGIRRGWIPL